MDAQQFNREMDARLSLSGIVDRQTFLQFSDAHSYNTASTVGWLEAKLRVLQSRIQRGEGLELYVPALGEMAPVTTFDAFALWACEHFPNASLQAAGAQPNNSFFH
jgi:hypothetical protein